MSKKLVGGLVVFAIILFGASGYMYYQQYGIRRCEACGMEIMPEMEQHLMIYDGLTNQRLYACCQGCALRLADPTRGHSQYRIETFCDYYGPDHKIIIDIKDYGNIVSVTPETARLLLGSKVIMSCANNRYAYDQKAAEELLKVGYTEHTMMWQHKTLPDGTPVMAIPEAAPMLAKMGISYTPPSPVLPALFVAIGLIVIIGSLVAYKKLAKK